jgi:uncharacterized protein (DUF1330 family)
MTTSFTPAIHPSPTSLAALVKDLPDDTPVTMLNLLRFRDVASYQPGAAETGAAGQSGRGAYATYSRHVMPLLFGVGGKPIWIGDAHCMVIAPPGESWDEAILVQYPDKHAFLQMIHSPEYQAIVHHRTAALADSRLVATVATAVTAGSDSV